MGEDREGIRRRLVTHENAGNFPLKFSSALPWQNLRAWRGIDSRGYLGFSPFISSLLALASHPSDTGMIRSTIDGGMC